MEKILFVNACVRQESRTRRLAEKVLSELSGEVTELKLWEEPLVPLDEATLQKRSAFTAQGIYTDEMFRYARQLAAADVVVIAAPYWDLSFPASVKVWIENISVYGITFRYTEDGRPEGLCRAKKLIYVTTAGGIIGQNNFGCDYISALFRNLYGVADCELVALEGLDMDSRP